MADPQADTPEGTVLLKSMQQEVHFLREELSGLREMLEGVTAALSGAQRAYAAVAQRAEVLENRMERMGRSRVGTRAPPPPPEEP